MANPQNPGTFEYWVSNRDLIDAAPPQSGNTGTLETWLDNRTPFPVYVAAAAATESVLFTDEMQGGTSDRMQGGFA